MRENRNFFVDSKFYLPNFSSFMDPFHMVSENVARNRKVAIVVALSLTILLLIFGYTKLPAATSKVNTLVNWSDKRQNDPSKRMREFLNTDTEKYITSSYKMGCGRLGNMIFRFASLYGIGRKTGRRPFVSSDVTCLKESMPEFASSFPNFADAIIYLTPNISEVGFVDYGRDDDVHRDPSMLVEQHPETKYLNLSGDHLQTFLHFHDLKPEIRKLFDFSTTIKEHVKSYANALFGNDINHKLCVHTRMGDLKGTFQESDLSFTDPAIEFVGKELKNAFNTPLSIVLLGEDAEFMENITVSKKIFDKKYFMRDLSRAQDLYFVSEMCDSFLMSASTSTFSWWAGYLMHEEKQGNIFYRTPVITMDHRYFKDTLDYNTFLPEWKRIRLLDGNIVYEPRWFYQILVDEAAAKNPKPSNGFVVLSLIAKVFIFLFLLLLVRVFIKFIIMLRRVRWQIVEQPDKKYCL